MHGLTSKLHDWIVSHGTAALSGMTLADLLLEQPTNLLYLVNGRCGGDDVVTQAELDSALAKVAATVLPDGTDLDHYARAVVEFDRRDRTPADDGLRLHLIRLHDVGLAVVSVLLKHKLEG
jgi:hypothetical protein